MSLYEIDSVLDDLLAELESHDLNEWEAEFVDSLQEQLSTGDSFSLSDKQRGVLHKMHLRYIVLRR